jgi:hypothetical protein
MMNVLTKPAVLRQALQSLLSRLIPWGTQFLGQMGVEAKIPCGAVELIAGIGRRSYRVVVAFPAEIGARPCVGLGRVEPSLLPNSGCDL